MKDRADRSGFSLIEVMIASVLSAMLLLMVSDVWFAMARSMADTAASSRVAADAGLAAESLRRDLSGHLPGAVTGVQTEGRMVGAMALNNQLLLCFDGPPGNKAADWTSPDTVVTYHRNGDKLLRVDSSSGGQFVAATGVDAFQVTELGTAIRIELTIARRGGNQTYTFESRDLP